MNQGIATYLRLLQAVKPYWLAFAAAIFGNILYAVVDGGFVKFLEPLLNQGFVGRDPDFIALVPVIVIGIFLVRGVASFCSTFYMGWVGRKVVMDYRLRMFDRLMRLPALFYDRFSVGQLISKLTFNVEQVADAATDALTILVRESSTLIALLAVMFSVSWRLTLIFLVTLPLMAVLMQLMSTRTRKVSTKIQNTMGNLTHVAGETIEGFKEVKLFGGQDYENDRFTKSTNENRQQEMKLIVVSAVAIPLVQFVGAFALAFTIYLATRDPNSSTAVTPGGFTAMISAMILILKPIKQLTKVNAKIQRGLAGAQSIFELLDEPEEVDAGTAQLHQAAGKVEFEQVSFTYPGTETKVLDNINFQIAPGSTVALVGHSGSGKSTLVNLLVRLYDCDGLIKIDDLPIKDITLNQLRQNFAYVSQHITLFNDTIANNIAYGMDRDQVTEQAIIDAAKTANAWEFISELPEGLNTLVGDNGFRLSGGQRQRLAIARALLKQAPILILDEATSALDTISERKIQQALTKLMGRCTTIVIAHRLATVEQADQIFVLDKGVIVEQGQHQQLVAKHGTYYNLVKDQFNSAEPKSAVEAG